MDYRPVLYMNPKEQDAPGKYYPSPIYEKTIGLEDFIKEISHATSLTPTDVHGVVVELIEIFRRYLVRGHKIRVPGIGTFKVSFKGWGEVTAEAVTMQNIDKSTIRITFVSDIALKKSIRSEISFSKVTEKRDEEKEAKEAVADAVQTE